MIDQPDGYPTLREALEEWQARRPPKDVVPPTESTGEPLPSGPAEVTYIDLDDDGIPRQHTETAWIAHPVGGDDA